MSDSAKDYLDATAAAVNDALDGRWVQMHRLASGSYELANPHASQLAAGDQRRVVPFVTVASWSFWLGVSVKVVEGARRPSPLREVQILVAAGELRSMDKETILRAEWGPSIEGPHAHPHWHVHGWGVERRGLPPARFSPTVNLSDSAPDVTDHGVAFDRFHLAMNARWHEAGTAQHLTPFGSAAGTGHWIRSCIVYIRQQIEHCFSRAAV